MIHMAIWPLFKNGLGTLVLKTKSPPNTYPPPDLVLSDPNPLLKVAKLPYVSYQMILVT